MIIFSRTHNPKVKALLVYSHVRNVLVRLTYLCTDSLTCLLFVSPVLVLTSTSFQVRVQFSSVHLLFSSAIVINTF